jgi:hypothetical protein
MATTTNYLQVNYDGTMFQYSKDAKEGFVKYINSAGTESFRKYFNKGVTGTLSHIDKKVNEKLNNTEEVRVHLRDGEENYVLTFRVMGQGDQIDDYTEQLIRYLPKLEKGTVYTINNWFMKKGDTVNGEEVKYDNKGLTVKIADTKIEPALSYQTDKNPDGNIPRLEFKETAGKKKVTGASKDAKFEFLYNTLVDNVNRLAYSGGNASSSTTIPKATPEQAFDNTTTTHNDLPF